MRFTKLLFLLAFFAVAGYAQTAPTPTPLPQQQRTISDIADSEFDEFEMLASGAFAERKVVGKVVGVHDGDTATVLDAEKRQYKFRFNGIDAPELKMDFGNKSKENLSNLIFGKEVTVIYSKVDKYGRFVGTIFVNGVNANLEQVKAGLAWHYKKYADEQSEADRKTYSDEETKAKAAKLGLWQMQNPTPPWDYRADKKVKQANEKANRKYLLGPRGGCYYINSNGNKTPVKPEFCANNNSTGASGGNASGGNGSRRNATAQPNTATQPAAPLPPPAANNAAEKTTDKDGEKSEKKTGKDGRTYIMGKRDGCYYLNESGKKVYVKDKSLCGL